MNESSEIHNAFAAHLRGTESIAATFGVGRATVRRWAREGAPISLVGRRYQASYAMLAAWLAAQYPAASAAASGAVVSGASGASGPSVVSVTPRGGA